MRGNMITSKAVIRSLGIALESVADPSQKASSIRRKLSKFPPGKLYVMHDGSYIRFYERIDDKKAYLKKGSDRAYMLARKRYLTALIDTLVAVSVDGVGSDRSNEKFEGLASLIEDFYKGNLDLARIAFAPGQYEWFVGKYQRKKISPEDSHVLLKNSYGDAVRSKSEQSVGNRLWDNGIPCLYEEQLIVNVQHLVDGMVRELIDEGWKETNIFYYRGGICYWNVPKKLQFMNAPGSLWHTYDYRSGNIRIYPDYTIMLADCTRIYWEHEGLLDSLVYRINAMDRIFVMRSAGDISPLDIIETEERESVDPEALDHIIRTRIIPRIWF